MVILSWAGAGAEIRAAGSANTAARNARRNVNMTVSPLYHPTLATRPVPSLPARGGWRAKRAGWGEACDKRRLLPTPALRADPPLAGRDDTARAATRRSS